MTRLMRTMFVATALIASTTFSPAALAKCPKNAAGVWSGMNKLKSFGDNIGFTDAATGLGRVVTRADGTFSGTLQIKYSDEPVGESSAISGNYTFDPKICGGSFSVGTNTFRYLITDNGRIMYIILFEQGDNSERDVNAFTFFRE